MNSVAARNRIRFILKKSEQSYRSKGVPGDEVRAEPAVIVRNFSDLIVRITPLTDRKLKDGSVRALDLVNEIVHESIDLCGAQFSLLEEGIVVRGGLTLGELYWEDGQVFGPALVRAYDLERELAQYPRIVIDSKIIDRLPDKKLPSILSWHSYMRQDSDGAWFLDFLHYFVAWSAPNIIFDRNGYRAPLENCRAFLVEQLSNVGLVSSRRAEYLWLAKYFNSVVERAPENSGVDWAGLKIPALN